MMNKNAAMATPRAPNWRIDSLMIPPFAASHGQNEGESLFESGNPLLSLLETLGGKLEKI
jgi:hypothetical protein